MRKRRQICSEVEGSGKRATAKIDALTWQAWVEWRKRINCARNLAQAKCCRSPRKTLAILLSPLRSSSTYLSSFAVDKVIFAISIVYHSITISSCRPLPLHQISPVVSRRDHPSSSPMKTNWPFSLMVCMISLRTNKSISKCALN